jgi:Zn-dependent hydrolases, including glyoxylases
MRKRTKIIIAAIAVVVCVLVIGFLLIRSKLSAETAQMAPLATKPVVDGIFAVQDGTVNMFVIQKADDLIAVDAGMDAAVIAAELKKINIDPDRIKTVFLTHTDRDHVGSLRLYKNAKVYLSTDEEQMVTGKKSRLLFFKNKVDVPYELVKDDQEITVGSIKVRGILTPGHTPGSMCYVIDDAYLFTGDTLSLKDGRVEPFNEFFNMDTETEKKSLSKLINLSGIKYIFTAHYGFSDDFDKAFGK